jgi:antirestriction protein ArdC
MKVSYEQKSKVGQLVLDCLAKGIIPWKQPWFSDGLNHSGVIILSDGSVKPSAEYTGRNAIVAQLASIVRDYSSLVWLTFPAFQRIRKINPEVRMKAGSKAIPIFRWVKIMEWEDKEQTIPKLDKKGDQKWHWTGMVFQVFNGDCFENLVVKETKAPVEVNPQPYESEDLANKILDSYPDAPRVYYDAHNKAYYDIVTDTVHLQKIATFHSLPEFVSTLAHELGHSTGANHRLKRDLTRAAYDYDELVAELTACLVCSHLGIIMDTIENSTAYINHWSHNLETHMDMFWDAMEDAVKSSNLILTNWKDNVVSNAV